VVAAAIGRWGVGEGELECSTPTRLWRLAAY
jgi:hypothetical protein